MLLAQWRKHTTLRVLTAGLAISVGIAAINIADAAPGRGSNAPHKTLKAFSSEQDMISYLKRHQKSRAGRGYHPGEPVPAMAPSAPPPAADAAAAPTSEAPSSITNTQEAGVDEGGIVKMRGDVLVILRRGRLFTVSTRDENLEPIDSIDAFPPGVDPRGDWYDEMLIAGNRVIVIGYSYARGGTEINRFHIDSDGDLSFEDSHHLRSNDYYSSRNYASRLIGTKLIVYTPLYVPYNAVSDLRWLPGLKRWRGSPSASTYKRTASATSIYMPVHSDSENPSIQALHSVTECDLAAYTLRCKSTAVFGPSGRTFYVSPHAVYVWVNEPRWSRTDTAGPSAALYRLPLDGSAPSAIGVRGAPTDQFSFKEDWNDGMLNVLVRGEGGGDAMWNPEFASGSVSLLQVPLGAFNDGNDEAQRRFYRSLPAPSRDLYAFQNKFVGDYVLYGSGAGWGRPASNSMLVAAAVRSGAVSVIPLQHGVDRIEAMGRDAVAIGSDGKDLHFRAVELTDGNAAHIGDRYTLPGASQGETRSHAFFFKPEMSPDRQDNAAGLMGLPVTRAGRPGYKQLHENSAAIVFVRRMHRQFTPVGELGAQSTGNVDDGCKASCVDWYGNSRPIFVRNRTFALMGYELVEGDVGQNSIRETRRVSFAPRRGW